MGISRSAARSCALLLCYSTVWADLVIDSTIPIPEQPAVQEHAPNTSFAYRFSSQPWIQYPGGLYKAVSTAEFPASQATSAALVKLNAGGMREMHYHEPNEWAYVLNGTCRATLVNQGGTHLVESWDYHEGDLWYFESNFPHVIIGVSDIGCTYLSVYDQGGFDERLQAIGFSGWYTQVPAGVAAQAFGLPNTTLLTDELVNATNNFLPQGNLSVMTAGDSDPSPVLAATSAPVRSVVNSKTHRYPLGTAGYTALQSDGGSVLFADVEYFPVATAMSGSLTCFKPGALRQLHWHNTSPEWQFVLNGTLQTQLYLGPGAVAGVNTLGPNDVGYVPKAVAHFIKNPDPVNSACAILVINNGSGTSANIDMTSWMGNYPLAYTALSLNVSLELVKQFNFSRTGLIGQGPGSRPNVSYSLSGVE